MRMASRPGRRASAPSTERSESRTGPHQVNSPKGSAMNRTDRDHQANRSCGCRIRGVQAPRSAPAAQHQQDVRGVRADHVAEREPGHTVQTALTEIRSSGAEVPKATMVRLTMSAGMPTRSDRFTAPRTSTSPASSRITRPRPAAEIPSFITLSRRAGPFADPVAPAFLAFAPTSAFSGRRECAAAQHGEDQP